MTRGGTGPEQAPVRDTVADHRVAMTAFAASVAVSAYFGTVGLSTGLLPLDPATSARLPWHSPVLAGVALGVIVGLPATAVSWLAWRRHPRLPYAATVAGMLLIGWIIVEVAIIREFSPLQPVYAMAGAALVRAGGRSAPREALRALGALPLLVSAPLYRRWHRHWGATRQEVAAAMAGDRLVPRAHFVATRAISIEAAPTQVWPWLVQVGFGRAGFYSYDLLDNLGRPSASSIHPEWQDLRLGGLAAPMTSPATPQTAFTVAGLQAPRILLWSKPDSTWSWLLTERPDGTTRVITRIRQRYRLNAAGLLSVILAEFGDFAMMRQMLLGLKRRCESDAGRAAGSGTFGPVPHRGRSA